MPPVLQEQSGDRRDQPLIGRGQAPPLFNMVADFINEWRGIVFLLLGGNVVEKQRTLALPNLRFLGFGTGVMRSEMRRLSMM